MGYFRCLGLVTFKATAFKKKWACLLLRFGRKVLKGKATQVKVIRIKPPCDMMVDISDPHPT